jgi:hypothetical protein
VNPLKAIRAKCLDCVCYQPSLVAECHIETCALHPFRMGKNPFRKHREISEAERSAMSMHLAAHRLAKSSLIATKMEKRGCCD